MESSHILNRILWFNKTDSDVTNNPKTDETIDDCLHKILQNPPNEDEKDAVFKKIAGLVFNSCKWPIINPRTFCQRLLSAYTTNTQFESGNSLQSAQYWIDFLDLWIKGEGILINSEISSKDLIGLKQILVTYNYFQEFIEKFGHTNCLDEPNFIKDIELVKEKCKNLFDENGRIYLPLGYRAGINNGGHALPCLLVKHKSTIKFHLMTRGAGVDNHPMSEMDVTPKYFFRALPIHLSEKDFFGELGTSLLSRLFRLNFQEPFANCDGYNPEDIYGALWAIGKVQGSYDCDLSQRSSKAQINFNCADDAVKLVVQDYLIEKKYSKKDIKRFFLNESLCLLSATYQTTQHSREPDCRIMLQNGLKEVSVTLSKKKSETYISEKEKLLFLALISYFNETSKNYQPTKNETSFKIEELLKEPLPVLFLKKNDDESVKSLSLTTYPITETLSKPRKLQTLFPLEKFHIQSCERTLSNWLATAKELYENKQDYRLVNFVYHAMLELPIPSTTNSVWNELPSHKIESVLEKIAEIVFYSLDEKKTIHIFHTHQAKRLVICYTAYAIADALVRRDPNNKLSGFASQFWLNPAHLHNDTILSSLFTFPETKPPKNRPKKELAIPIREITQRLFEIKKYFNKLASSCEKTLFYFDFLQITEILNKKSKDFSLNSKETKGGYYVDFLLQFLDEARLKGLKAEFAEEEIIQLCNDAEIKYLPKQIHLLRYLSFLSAYMGGGRYIAAVKPPINQNHLLYTYEWNTLILRYTSFYKCPVSNEKFFMSKELNLEFEPEIQASDSLYHIISFGKESTVNECLSHTFQQEGFTKRQLQEIARMMVEPNLSIYTLFMWLEDNFLMLSYPVIQRLIENILFPIGRIQKEMNVNAFFISQLQQFLLKSFSYYYHIPNQFDAWLFLVRLCYNCASFFDPNQRVSFIYKVFQDSWMKYQECIDPNEKYALATILIHFFTYLPIEEKADANKIVDLWISHNTLHLSNTRIAHWYIINARDVFDRCEATLRKFFDLDPSWRTQKCETILHSLNIQTDSSCWEGQYPIFSNGEITIDLFDLTVTNADQQFKKYRPSRDLRSDHPLFSIVKKYPQGFWKNGELWQSPDQIYSFIERQGKQTLFKKMAGPYGFVTYELQIENPQDSDSLKFLSKYLEIRNLSIWSTLDPKPHKLICDKKQIPHFAFIQEDQNEVCYRLDSNGKLTNHRLVNFQSLERDSSHLYLFLKNLQLLDQTLCWVNEDGLLVEMEFFEHELNFQRDGAKLVWEHNPDYYLIFNKYPPLSKFKGYLMVTNDLDTLILIPNRSMQVNFDNFTSEISFEKRASVLNSNHNKKSYHSYSLNQEGELQGSNPSSQLFLVLIFAALRNFELALKYLTTAKTFKYFTISSKKLSFILHLKDFSPPAIAFNLHFALFIFENRAQLLANGFNQSKLIDLKIDNKIEEFVLWIRKSYEQYIFLINQQSDNRIPYHLRLSHEQELLLIRYLKPLLQKVTSKKNKEVIKAFEELKLGSIAASAINTLHLNSLGSQYDWNYIFETRLSILSSPDGLHNYTIPFSTYLSSPKEYLTLSLVDFSSLAPPKFDKDSNKEVPSHFVRIQIKELDRYFYYFYQLALDAPFPSRIDLDILYIANSNSSHYSIRNPSPQTMMAALLLLIRRNNQKFKDLRFDESKSNQENDMIFKKIIERATSVLSSIKKAFSCITDIYKSSTFFAYKTSGIIKLDKKLLPNYAEWKFEEVEKQALTKRYFQPFKPLLSSLLKEDTNTSGDRYFFICSNKELFSTNSEKNLIQDLLDGFNLSNAKKKQQLLLQFNQSREKFAKVLNSEIDKYSDDLEKIKSKIEAFSQSKNGQRIAKVTKKQFEQDCQLFLKQQGKLIAVNELEGSIFNAIFYKKPNLIAENNPSLSNQEIKQILLMAYDYFFKKMIYNHLIVLLRESLSSETSESKLLELFSESYNYQFDFDPFTHPELLLIQYRTKKVFRTKQGELISWIIKSGILKTPAEFNKLLFSFPAGAGKTSIIIPTLNILAKLAGFMPLTIAPKSLFTIDRENLKNSLNQICHNTLLVSELNLDTKTKSEDFEHFYQMLLDADKANSHFEFTPQDFYTLDLKYDLALEQKDANSVKWLSLIRDFFEKRVLCFIDEVKVNLHPKTRAKIGIGKPIPLLKEDISLFIFIYKILIGHKDFPLLMNGPALVAQQLGILQDNQATISIDEKCKIREALAKYLITCEKLAIATHLQSEVLNYWLNQEEAKSISLMEYGKVSPQFIRMIDLTRGFLNEFFLFVMDLTNCMNYGPSINPGQEIYAPKRKRESTTALYEDPYVTLVITIQGMLQNGLSREQCKNLIKNLLMIHEQEQYTLGINAQSSISIVYDQWLKDSTANQVSKKVLPLHELNWENEPSIDYIFLHLRNNVDVIFWYIEHVMTSQFLYYPEQLETTPTKLFNSFNTIGFSATIGQKEEYAFHPPKLSPYFRQDLTFAANVLFQLSQPLNQKIHVFENTELDCFFVDLFKKDPEDFLKLSMINDAGGFLKVYSNFEIASSFCHFVRKAKIHFDGILFFDKSADKNHTLNHQSQLYFWHINWEKPKPIVGNDLKQAFLSFQFDWKKLKIMTFLDPSHIEGFHIDLSQDACALLLVGENLNQTDLCQAAMRLRNLLHGQRIIWGIEYNVAKSIECLVKKPLNVESIISWTIKNEAKELDVNIPMSAYEEIEYLCEQQARELLKKALNDPHKQIAIFHRYRSGFVKKNSQDPSLRFGSATTMKSTRDVLMAYARSYYEKFGYNQPFDKNKPLQTNLDLVIQKLEKWQTHIPNKQMHNLNRECHIHLQQQQNQKELLAHRFADLKPVKENPIDYLDIYSFNLIHDLKKISQSFQIAFESPYFTNNLWITENALNTASSGGINLGKRYLKQVNYLLMIKEKEGYFAWAISDTEAKTLRKKMQQPSDLNVNRKLLLITARGAKVQNACNLPFSLNELSEMENSAWYQNVLLETSLISVKIHDLKTLVKRLQNWPDFPKLLDDIYSWQPHQANDNCAFIKKLIDTKSLPDKKAEESPLAQQSSTFSLFKFFKGK